MKELIEDYERRLKTVMDMIEHTRYDNLDLIRLKTKASCYRTFLAELKHQSNVTNVLGG